MKNQSLVWCLCLSVLFSCSIVGIEKGNGEITSEKRILDEFSAIQLTGNFEITLKKGGNEQIVIVTDENLLEYIGSEIEQDILVIENSKKLQSNHGIKVFITYSKLEKLKSIGASIIKTDGPLVSERFELEVPGASLVDMEVEVTDLEIMLAGAGAVTLKGRAENQSISMNGVGNLAAYELESNFCEVTVSGMGSVEVNVKENLNARVNGVGSIRYKGNPTNVTDRISGLGTIDVADEEEFSDQTESI